MNKKLYGILPYVFLDEPLEVAGVCFESHRAGLRRVHEEQDLQILKQLNSMFLDELGHRTEVATWFVIDNDGGSSDAEFDFAYSRLIAALQFALLERGDYREQPCAESVDAHLFELEHAPDAPAEGFLLRSRGLFTRPRHIWTNRDTFYPRAPNIRFPSILFPVSKQTAAVLDKLVPPNTPFRALGSPDFGTLDSLSLFVQSSASPETTDLRARIVLIAAAFETLLEIGRLKHKAKADDMAKKVVSLVEPLFQGWQPRDMKHQLANLRKFCADFYKLRSAILHEGKVQRQSLVFKAKRTADGFVGFFWKARQIYACCIHAQLGMLEPWQLSLILSDLVSNEDRLKRIRRGLESGDPDQAQQAAGLCSDLHKYPTPESAQDIIETWRILGACYGSCLEARGRQLPKDVEQALHEENNTRLRIALQQISGTRNALPIEIHGDLELLVFEHAICRFADYAAYALMFR